MTGQRVDGGSTSWGVFSCSGSLPDEPSTAGASLGLVRNRFAHQLIIEKVVTATTTAMTRMVFYERSGELLARHDSHKRT